MFIRIVTQILKYTIYIVSWSLKPTCNFDSGHQYTHSVTSPFNFAIMWDASVCILNEDMRSNGDTLATNCPQQLRRREIFNGALCRRRVLHHLPCISARDECVWEWWLDTDLVLSVSWKDGNPVCQVCRRQPKQQTGWCMATLWASAMTPKLPRCHCR